MSDSPTNEARTILAKTFQDLARVGQANSMLRSVLDAVGGAIAPDGAVNGATAPKRPAEQRAASKPARTSNRAQRTTGAKTSSTASPSRGATAERKPVSASTRSRSATRAKATSTTSPSRPAAKRKVAGTKAGPSAATPGRGTRKDQVLAIITRQPGISIAAVAKELSVAPTGLYPVARRLETEGRVKKVGTGWHPDKK